MKQSSNINHSSGYLFPVEVIRDYLLNTTELYPVQIPAKTSLPTLQKKKTKANTENPDQLINRVRDFYDANTPFDTWLNHWSTKCNMLANMERLILHQSGKRKDFLQEIGLDASEFMAGQYIGKMHAIYPIVRMNEMLKKTHYKKYPLHLYELDERWLKLFLRTRHRQDDQRSALSLIRDCRNIQEMTLKVFKLYFDYSHTKRIEQYYRICLIRHAYTDLYQMMFFGNLTPIQLAGYCIGALQSFNVINDELIQDINENRYQKLADMCSFYSELIQLDYSFVQSHFPISLEIFLGKRPFNILRIKTLLIKHTIYKASLRRKPFAQVMQSLVEYEQKLNLIFDLKPTSLSHLYYQLPDHDKMWAFRNIGKVLEVHQDNSRRCPERNPT